MTPNLSIILRRGVNDDDDSPSITAQSTVSISFFWDEFDGISHTRLDLLTKTKPFRSAINNWHGGGIIQLIAFVANLPTCHTQFFSDSPIFPTATQRRSVWLDGDCFISTPIGTCRSTDVLLWAVSGLDRQYRPRWVSFTGSTSSAVLLPIR